MNDDYTKLAIRLFGSPEWVVIPAVLADIESEAVNNLRDKEGDFVEHVHAIRMVGRVRTEFRRIAADAGVTDPFD